jgi:hypothetical protein
VGIKWSNTYLVYKYVRAAEINLEYWKKLKVLEVFLENCKKLKRFCN